ncbi:MAG TPA: VOC family protein [Vicinamibacterales bacterium]|nr:VOC family protein [Vicinamibacterales bacterium]
MHVHHHAPGSFCWFELSTTNQAQAKAFYGALFGWQPDDQPVGPNDVYTIFKVDGRDAAAACTIRPDQLAHGARPNWLLYVSVENADASAKRATDAGGKLLMPPFDVMESGRMALVADPTGAAFAIWEPRNHHGTGIVGDNGTAVWADLNTPDPVRAARFYHALFNWKIVAGKTMAPAGPDDYGHIVNGQEFIGGVPPAAYQSKGAPPHWLIYFAVPDCDTAAANAKSAGGAIVVPPMTAGEVRKFAVLADPQGAAFAIVEPRR